MTNINEEKIETIPDQIQQTINENWNLTTILNGQGYRKPKEEFLIKLISKLGPLWSSSANTSGKETLQNLEDFTQHFSPEEQQEIMLVDTGNSPEGQSSTIYDYDNKKLIRGNITLIKHLSLELI